MRITVTTKVFWGVVFLMCGCMIYLLFRSKSLNIYLWSRFWGFSGLVDYFRDAVQGWQVGNFVKFSLADGLYCASYIFFIDAIWHKDKKAVKHLIVAFIPTVAIVDELFQYYGITNGTFDTMDMVCYFVPIAIYFLVIYINKFKIQNL